MSSLYLKIKLMGWNDVDKWSNLGGSNLGVTRFSFVFEVNVFVVVSRWFFCSCNGLPFSLSVLCKVSVIHWQGFSDSLGGDCDGSYLCKLFNLLSFVVA